MIVELSSRDRTLTLVGILLALFLGALDQTIVSTALPRIVADLSGLDRYAWVATAYLLASTSLVPLYGRLADTHNRRTIELWAVSLFLAGSFLSGLAGEFGRLPILGDGMSQLILFRGLQGLGGAGIFSMAFIVIADLFPPAQRGRYQGLVGACFGIASVLGPLLGGLLTDHAGGVIPGVEGWRWVFYVNVPFGALALWFIIRRMPTLPPGRRSGGLDGVAAALLIGGLVPIVLGLQLDKRRFPWLPGMGLPGSPRWEAWLTLGLLAFGALALRLFWRRSQRSSAPILDPALFAGAVFRRANLAAFLLGAAFLSVLLFLPLFVVNVVGVSATRAGLSLIPLSLGLVAGSVIAGQLASSRGRVRGLMVAAALLLLVGVGLLASMDAGTGYATVTSFMVLCGLGIGPTFPLYTLAIQNAVHRSRLGQATSAAQFFRQIGGTVGAALMGTVLALGLVRGFERADLPAGTLAGGAAAVVRAGGADVLAGFRRRYAQADSLLAAWTAGDEVAGRTFRGLTLPDGPALDRLEARVGPPGTTPDRDSLEALRGTLRAHARRRETEIDHTIRATFAAAIRPIFLLTEAIVLLALLVTARIPDYELRTTQDAPPPEGASV